VISFFDEYFGKRAPALPANVKEWIVQYSGWIAVIVVVLSIPMVTLVLGLDAHYISFGNWSSAYSYGYGLGFYYWPLTIGIVTHFVLMAMAIRGLFARKMSAWQLVFFAQAAHALGLILSGAFVNGLLGALISFYILFQIRPLYKS
jgi:hypothetical protein